MNSLSTFPRLCCGILLAVTLMTGAFSVGQSVPVGLAAVDLPDLSINNVSQTEGDSGLTTFTFIVSLSTPAGLGGVTFDIATADGSATSADSDYVTRSLTGQTIPEGGTSFTFDVSVRGDGKFEVDEVFLVNVTNLSGANLVDDQGSGTILNDDPAAAADVSVTVTDTPDPAVVSGLLTYTIAVANAGPSDATQVYLTDALPVGLAFVSLTAPAGWFCTTPAVGVGGVVSCGTGLLSWGSALEFSLVVGITAGSPEVGITNTVTVTRSEVDPIPANDSATASTALDVYETTTELNVTYAPSGAWDAWLLSATVNCGAGTPTGSVTFRDGAVSLGESPLVDGVAEFNLMGLGVGWHILSAAYGGEGVFPGSVSQGVAVKARALLVLPVILK